MTTLLFSDPVFLEHDTGPGHPESPQRYAAIAEALAGDDFAALVQRRPPRDEKAQIARVHEPAYVDRIIAAEPSIGRVHVDPDTVLSPGSVEVALRAAGAVCAAVDAVCAGEGDNAFCPVRPPGHHAEANKATGFCFFNNVAVGAAQARAAHGLGRVAVVDFDVHHGNGTQAMFADEAELFYGSTHQWPCYPGTGAEFERGVAGNIVNRPLAPGSGGDVFRSAFAEGILPALDAFKPEFVLISAGFGAHTADPLAQLHLVDDDFAWATREVVRLARAHCGGKIVSTLEGGYDLPALAAATAAHVRALMEA